MTIRILDHAPALGPLYARAACGTIGPRPVILPDVELVRAEVRVDRDHLAAYARICGFALDDALPATYPHLLAFPMQVALMADRAFPLPLPGLVHVHNTITVRRAVSADDPLHIGVHAERFVAHPKGAQVDLVASVRVDGEPVWDGRSTYLARGASAPTSGEDLPAPTGALDGPPVAVWRVDAGTGRRYAGVSGDVNPIHLYPLTARAFGFPRAIAHGMWTAARTLAHLQARLPGALTHDVSFGRPLLLPSTVELRTRPVDGGWDIEVRSGRGGHLTAMVRPPAS